MEECSAGEYSLGYAVKCTICPAGSRCPRKDVNTIDIFL